ncbi:DMT family transporter [Neopusillimonas aromaticivorans]|uniref:DMT family transporter n=1 Tax=Neopusillimonas aromaticivorans TaxID=2979868 RepID=UPI002597648D|nr:DMT family transporter [Neopusillimonas aromaticivorans]WJJ94675.1 DMT family transporter [Neopusillimonas aromaticivorans]
MQTRKAIDTRAVSIMTVLCMIWAFQQIAIKAAAPDIAPILQIALRSGIAIVLVGLLMLWQRVPLSLADGGWRPGLLVGFLFALEFWLIGEGLRHTTASHMTVFLYTAPFFAAIGLHWRLPEERLALVQWFGIFIAFIGVAMAFFGPDASDNPRQAADMLWGDFLGLLAGAAWGATTVVIRCSKLSNTPATVTLMYQLVGAFVLLLAAAFVMGQARINFTPVAIGSVLFQGVVVSFITFLTWFWLLRNYLASRLGVFSFMTPMFAIVFGVWLLDEPLDTRFLVGAVLVAAGIVLVSGYGWFVQLKARRRGL